MGGYCSTKTQDDSAEMASLMYEKLRNKGFEMEISFQASRKFPNDLDKALNFISAYGKYQNLANDDLEPLVHENNDSIHKDYINDSNMESTCDHTKCESLQRIIKILTGYKFSPDFVNDIEEFFNEHQNVIITDYHHVINTHLNEDMMSTSSTDNAFEYIYNTLIQEDLFCDIKNCVAYRRNNRDRNQNIEDDEQKLSSIIPTEVDFIDCIHCYFLHSVDTGLRIVNEKNNATDVDEKENEYIDNETRHVRFRLSKTQNRMTELRGTSRVKQSKFITQLITIDNEENEEERNEDDNHEPSDYKFGLRFSYEKQRKVAQSDFTYEDFSDAYDFPNLCALYSDLKQEIISNKIHELDITTFNNAYQKAVKLMTSSNYVKCIKCTEKEWCLPYWYEVEYESLLTINHILSIIFYCDYDQLSYHFSSSFRRIAGDNDDKDVLSRNLQFGNWTRYLTQTVNCFGTQMGDSKFGVLYHGVSFLYLNEFVSTFNAPTSTTTKLAVAYTFAAPQNGIIIDIGQSGSYGSLRYFNCSSFSFYPNEDERLFTTPPNPGPYRLATINIRNISIDEQYSKYISILTLMQTMIGCGGGILMNIPRDKEIIDGLNELVQSYLNSDDRCPEYIQISFKKWANSITKIKMSMSEFDGVVGCILAESSLMFFEKHDNYVVDIDYFLMNKIFINVELIEIRVINMSFSSLLRSVKKINDYLLKSKLKTISIQIQNKIYFDMDSLRQYSAGTQFTNNNWKLRTDATASNYHDWIYLDKMITHK
eukprot:292537_1